MVTWLIQWNYRLQNRIITILQQIFFRPYDKNSVKKILVWRGGSLGDNVCALPAMNAISENFSLASIDLLTNSRGAHLVSLQQLIAPGIIGNVFNLFPLSFQQKFLLFQFLRAHEYDLFIEIPENLATLRVEIRNIAIAKLLGIPSGFGWEVASSRLFKKYQAKVIPFENETQRLLNILERNQLWVTEKKYPLGWSDTDRDCIKKKLKEKSLLDKNKNIGFVVGAKRKANRWPIQYFEEVIRYLIAQGFNIFLIGGKEDFSLAATLVFDKKVHNFCGSLTPLQSGILFQYCRLTISNDTGPMHLSYAAGTPVVAVFSARDYAQKWFPPKELGTVFRKDTVCSPCFLNDCPYDNLCLREIQPTQILKELHARGL
ncbi:MAG: glycosyltransferase family 9 protein [SAR324 cluster bacterium]|nr:glycosyltransferase family 9 protein [SAR324 cluster bacterium]